MRPYEVLSSHVLFSLRLNFHPRVFYLSWAGIIKAMAKFGTQGFGSRLITLMHSPVSHCHQVLRQGLHWGHSHYMMEGIMLPLARPLRVIWWYDSPSYPKTNTPSLICHRNIVQKQAFNSIEPKCCQNSVKKRRETFCYVTV